MPKSLKPKPPSWKLCIDTAKNSGWCIVDNEGRYVDSGEVNAFVHETKLICARVVDVDVKPVLLMEKPSHGNRASLVGMGAARGAWIAAWLQAGGKKPRDVFPATWRSKLFGDTSKNPTRERLAAQIFSRKPEVGPDEAAAVCIAVYAARHLK